MFIYKRIIILLGLIICGGGICSAESPLARYPQLMDTLVGGHYPAAAVICDELAQQYGRHPAVFYARAALAYAHMIDFEDTVGRAAFLNQIDSTIFLCDAWQSHRNEPRAELCFLRGSALAAKGLLLNHEGNLLSGLRHLMSARAAFDEALETDSLFYDAYLGRGAYRYGAALHAGQFAWLPFIPSLESGWNGMWGAVEKSRFSKHSALTALVWFVLEQKRYTLADSICREELSRFPRSRSFLWPELSSAEHQRQWERADTTARELLDQYLKHPDNNGYETTGLYWKLSVIADTLGRPKDATTFARQALAAYRTPDAAAKRRGKLRDIARRLAADTPSTRPK
jgi:tetratricopeptide (TPR) repeat protein